MPRQGKREYVSFKSVRLPLYPHGKGWRFAYPDDSVKGGWRYGYRSNKKEAKESAHCKAVEIANGFIDLANLSTNDAKLCREFLNLNPTLEDLERLKNWHQAHDISLSETVTRFASELPKPLSRHHKGVLKTLRELEEFTENKDIGSVQKDDLTQYLATHDVGATRMNGLRANIVQLFNWAKRESLVDATNGLTVADRIPRKRPPKQKAIRYLSPDEMRFLLTNVREQFLPWIVLCGFSPIRSEELHARLATDKPPLNWSSVKISQGIIEIPAEISKVKKRRIITINETLSLWLKYLNPPLEGQIVPSAPNAKETGRLGKIMNKEFNRSEGWPKNSLRHTFLTFQAALTKDLPAIAFEAGTSVQKLNSNYVEATHENEAKKFFELNPSDVFRTQPLRNP